jgi:hypothetical protein
VKEIPQVVPLIAANGPQESGGFTYLSNKPFENGHEDRAHFDDVHQLPSIFTELIQFATNCGCRFGAWNLDELHAVLPSGRHYLFAPVFAFAHRAFCAFEIAFRAFADIVRRLRGAALALSRPLLRMNFTGKSSPSTASLK